MHTWFRLIKQADSLSAAVSLKKINQQNKNTKHNRYTLKVFFVSEGHTENRASSSYGFIVK
jgi:hypothetical protein